MSAPATPAAHRSSGWRPALAPIQYRRPWLYPKQHAAIFAAARYAVIEASTKAGKTVGCLAWLFEQAALTGRPGRHYWWVAPTFAVTRIAFRRLTRAVPRELVRVNESELTITLANGATIWFKSAEHPNALYGEDVYAAVIDEATRCREEAWHAVRTTLTATRGPVRVIGNVKGRKNWAYRLARAAQGGAPGMHYAKLTAYDAVEASVIAAAEVEDARGVLPEAVFRELYLAEPSDDGGNPFGIAAIRACIAPLSTAPPKAWGWDLAKSVDWTVGIALDAAGAVCRVERWQLPWEQTMRRIRALTGEVTARIDSTGVGDPIVELLAVGQPNVSGYHFTAASKQQLMEGLAAAIQRRAVRYPDGVIVQELEAYEYVYTRTGVRYSAPEGSHDDAVCALALAVSLVQTPRPMIFVGRA